MSAYKIRFENHLLTINLKSDLKTDVADENQISQMISVELTNSYQFPDFLTPLVGGFINNLSRGLLQIRINYTVNYVHVIMLHPTGYLPLMAN